ncbi:MAG: hypothetical protein ABFR63_12120, partial [Thermodesulfobacteriota bacterium]
MKNLFSLFTCLVFLFFSGNAICSENPLNDWDLRYNASGSLGDVAYGNGVFVAVGHAPGGTIMFSPDGNNWSPATDNAGSNSTLSGLAFGEGIFVATGGHPPGEILTSSDGSNWQRQGVNATDQIMSCATYGDGTFVAAGSKGWVVISDDGISWIAYDTEVSGWYRGITFANGLFVAVNTQGNIVTS